MKPRKLETYAQKAQALAELTERLKEVPNPDIQDALRLAKLCHEKMLQHKRAIQQREKTNRRLEKAIKKEKEKVRMLESGIYQHSCSSETMSEIIQLQRKQIAELEAERTRLKAKKKAHLPLKFNPFIHQN
ncbi:hypothetical protein [Tunicatimonas pelagia]|uniref:hypothetical protein n=1 Tax=Tunicatimonas pelagia TaxID=931531 RepID=UPI002665CCDF|nr:hypothetical protein [Tunicatimonas pelagia]WKN42202.1 hypothetical protein P0M28_24500 [Tunicatimonas pelagia]WKN45320.1 hypothetical protein P0M28_10150 [Tunicatimonas pelagia]